jgi:hypothetical protein
MFVIKLTSLSKLVNLNITDRKIPDKESVAITPFRAHTRQFNSYSIAWKHRRYPLFTENYRTG